MSESRTRHIFDKLMHSDTLTFTLARSIISSQAASWLDLISGFILFALAGMSAFWSAAMGAVAGGVLNCIINYRFTFHAAGCPWKAVAMKYTVVWIGSVLLNSFGTDLTYKILTGWHVAEDIGISNDACYATARLFVSLAVSLVWNFLLQRIFVYRHTRFDNLCITAVNMLLPRRLRSAP